MFPNLGLLREETMFYLHDGTHTGRSLLGIGNHHSLRFTHPHKDVYEQLDAFLKCPGWKMGYLSYDLKNATEDLRSNDLNPHHWPSLLFVVPRIVLSIERGKITILQGEDQPDLNSILEAIEAPHTDFDIETLELQPRISKHEYLHQLETVQKHIQRGDIYEMNFCQEFFHPNAHIEPSHTYTALHKQTKAPFSCYMRTSDHYLMCGSPERYLSKTGQKVISQPIKGTIRRGKNKEEDEVLKAALKSDPKERSENIMITDLVRNDLNKVAVPGTVTVPELCEIYSFETVHQMISTVEATLPPSCSIGELLKATFPMGSMTGAPKIKAMEIIDSLEHVQRGIYSGAVGYVDPEGNCDFNVVIRSLIYHAGKKYLSAMVGGAITAQSIAEKEYEECLLKAEALFQSLRS